MKLEIGVAKYPSDVGRIQNGEIRGRKAGRNIPLVLVKWEEMESRHKRLPNVRGMPMYVSQDEAGLVWLHPIPDGEYWLDLTGAPAAPAAVIEGQKDGKPLGLPKRQSGEL